MKDFFWNYFAVTGNLEAYMFYKNGEETDDIEPAEDDPELDGEELA